MKCGGGRGGLEGKGGKEGWRRYVTKTEYLQVKCDSPV